MARRRKNDLWDFGGGFSNDLWGNTPKRRYTKKRTNYGKNNYYRKSNKTIDPIPKFRNETQFLEVGKKRYTSPR